MKTAIEKTNDIKRIFAPIGSLEANPNNPNEMSDAEFNLLYDNIERMGMTDPIFVIPHPDKKDMFRIIGGEHRWEVAKLLEFSEVPVTVVDDTTFTEDEQKFQIVRHNIIHGAMSPKKFMDLYQSLSEEYTQEVAAEMFGFTDEQEFAKLLGETRNSLPKELLPAFDEAKGELKTIDDLSSLLNKLFSMHGDTLPFGYMIFDFGGKESVWLRMESTSKKDFMIISGLCREYGRTLDGVMSEVLKLLAHGDNEELRSCFEKAPSVVMDNLGEDKLPTLDYLDEL